MNQDTTTTKAARFIAAAQPCPPEHRAAYAHLLAKLYDEAAEELGSPNKASSAYADFETALLRLLIYYPALDPWDMAEVTEALTPVCPREMLFAEQLRMLSRLREANAAETTTEGRAAR